MQLQIPIPVTFKIKMETERALILTDISLDGQIIVQEGVIPKMCANVTDKNNGFIESWVIEQRIKEEKLKNVEDAKRNILELIKN